MTTNVERLKILGRKIADQQGLPSDSISVAPFWFSVADSKTVGIAQFQNNYSYEPRQNRWVNDLGTDRGYFLYGKLFMTAMSSVTPTDNYEISLAIGSVYSNLQTMVAGNNIVASRGTAKNPFGTKINPTNFFDPLLYQSSYPELFLRPSFIVGTNGTGTITYAPYAQFDGWIVQFN